MESAMELVQTGRYGTNEAARMYGIPPTTLKDRISGKVKHGTKSGPVKYLSSDEEAELADFLKQSSELGYGKTRKDVLNIAESYASQKGVLRKESGITQGWWRSFRDRQADLSLRRGDGTANIRMDAVNEETISHYFSLLQDVMQKNGITNSPGQIYNVDESGVPLDPKAPNVVAKTGTKKVRYRSTGRKGQITIVACGSATGQVIPPAVIFEGKNMNHAWQSGGLPGMRYGCSDSGWITTDLFESWLSDHFLKHAVSERPLLLLLDGHSTHYQPEVIRYARSNKVLILCLPPHTTHEAQPLDCTVFSPLKTQWRAVCHDFFQANPGQVITKFNFVSLFVEAWSKAVTPSNLISGFRTCGIYPVNASAIPVKKVKSADSNSKAVRPSHSGVNAGDNGDASKDRRKDDFSEEQEMLFKRRYEEGYDLYVDSNYVKWMRLNHPEIDIPIPTEQSTRSPPNPFCVNEVGSADNNPNAVHPCHNDINAEDNGDASTDGRRDEFTVEQEMLFKRRYEEGYDLYVDADYVRWMRWNHPEVDISIPTEQETGSLLDSFPGIISISPIPIDQQASDEPISMCYEQSSSISEATSSGLQPPVASEQQLLVPEEQSAAATSLPPIDNQTSNILSSSPKNSTPPFREFLIYPATIPITSGTPAPPKRSVPKARLLTSDESLAIIEEKEKAKKDALLEKERKKAERIAKKQQREEEMKKKKEERARKAEERAREKAKKQQEKSRTKTRGSAKRKSTDQNVASAQNESAATGTTTTIITRTATSGARNDDVSVTNAVANGSSLNSASVTCHGQDPATDGEDIDPDTCCMCFGSYEDDVIDGGGAQWISCRCGRWLHEDCVEETVVDSDGHQRFCIFCVDKYTM